MMSLIGTMRSAATSVILPQTGKSGSDSDIAKVTRLTPSGRAPQDVPVRGFYVENDLPSWRQLSAFQHHVRVSRTGEREDCTYAGLKFATINELGDCAQPFSGDFHQKERCRDTVVLCAMLIGLGHGGDQLATPAKNLKGTHLRFAPDEIEYRVGILHLILEWLCMIIQHLVGTE
jgi:hypothetical protein